MSIVDLSPGQVLAERYRIVGPNRQGGLSAVLEVRTVDEDERFELQLFPAGLFDRRGQVAEFARELEPWRAVRSPWVARVREILMLDASHLALVSDFPGGESLRARLNEVGALPAEEAVTLGLRLLEGLAAVHERSLVHGDLKPHTIYVRDGEGDDGPLPTIVDGGVTPVLWSIKGLGEKTALLGTPYYAPVEQFGGDAPKVGSDIYNVATVLYECLTGVLPWPGKSLLQVFQAKLEKRPPAMALRAPQVPVAPALEAVIVRGCMADRHERYASAMEFHAALADAL